MNFKDYPYEIHLTIETEDISYLQSVIDKIPNTKLIILDLYRNGKQMENQQVTTSTYVPVGILWNQVLCSLKSNLMHRFQIIRTKIETVPWHPYAAQINPKRFDRHEIYFETHYKWLIPTNQLFTFRNSFSKQSLTHLSRNALKHPVNGETAIMGTVRTYDRTYEKHKEVLEQEEKEFIMPYIKKVSEFAFLDSYRVLDKGWLRK